MFTNETLFFGNLKKFDRFVSTSDSSVYLDFEFESKKHSNDFLERIFHYFSRVILFGCSEMKAKENKSLIEPYVIVIFVPDVDEWKYPWLEKFENLILIQIK
jgi:hypothetical protein